MALINVEKLVPEVYVEESRDFQLLCRLYSLTFSSLKYDVDSIQSVIDTKNCRERVLKLLQTKLGFFTTTSVTDEELRYVLQAFPTILKYKGSLKAVQMSVATFLKAKHISADYAVQYVTEEGDDERTGLKPYTIGISINTSLVSHELLQAILKYVIPAGFNLSIYFFNKIEVFNNFIATNNAKVLYVYYYDNSKLRGAREQDNTYLEGLRTTYGRMDAVSGETEGQYYADVLVNAVDTVMVANKNELIDLNINKYKHDKYVNNSSITVQEISNRLNSYILSSSDITTYQDLGLTPIDSNNAVENEVVNYEQLMVLGGKIPRYDKTRRHPMTYYSELIPYVCETNNISKDSISIDFKTLSTKLSAFVTYVFEYVKIQQSWYLNSQKVSLSDYGITIDTAETLVDGATITLTIVDQRGTIDHVSPVNYIFSRNDREDNTK